MLYRDQLLEAPQLAMVKQTYEEKGVPFSAAFEAALSEALAKFDDPRYDLILQTVLSILWDKLDALAAKPGKTFFGKLWRFVVTLKWQK